MTMGSSLTPIVSSIFKEHSEKLALDSAQYKPSLWLQYVDDTFVVWLQGPEQLHNFLSHLSSFRPSIQFTIGIDSVLFLFWKLWSSGKGWHWLPKLTENPPTLAITTTSNLTIRHTWKEAQFRIFTIVLPPYAKYDMICLMKLLT
jgi:hypothetical protein